MSWKQMWTIKEASMAADVLDEAGEFEQASLLDEYIEAATNQELVVQAGLWEKFKGWAKTKMFGEYKELVTKAREAQSAIEANMKEIEEGFDQASSDLKNYRLNEWRLNLHNMRQKAIDINRLVVGFDMSYGRFLSAVVGVKKLDPTDDAGTMSASEQVAKIFETPEGVEGEPANPAEAAVKEDVKNLTEGGMTSWSRLDRRQDWHEHNQMTGEVRVKNHKIEQLNIHTKSMSLGDGTVAYAINREAKGKLPEWVETLMGDKALRQTNKDQEWTYFQAVESAKEEPKTDEQVPAEEPISEPTPEPAPEPTPEPAPEPQSPEEKFEQEPGLKEVPPEAAEGTVPKSRRKMTRKERGEVLVRPKDGGRARWMSKDKYEAHKDKLDLVGEQAEERVARILELLIKEG